MSSNIPHLLRLPVELRHQIYAHVYPPSPTSHPLPSVGITSITHSPPPLSHLLVHHQITDDILDYYFTTTTSKLIFSHAFNFFRTDPYLNGLEKSSILRRLRKVEVVFFCDILLLREYPSFGLESFCNEIKRRAERACEVLAKATELREMTVSWVDTTLIGEWEGKAEILLPLRRLAENDKVKFRIGEVTGPQGEGEREAFLRAMKDVLGGRCEGLRGRQESVESVASDLRMLAFDPRQERDLIGWEDEGVWRRQGKLEAWQMGPREVGRERPSFCSTEVAL